MKVEQRLKIEKQIAKKVADCLLNAGYLVAVNDGEEIAQEKTSDKAKIIAAMFSTDQDYLIAFDTDGNRIGWVRFIYGNDGWDVIADNTVNLEEVIADATALALELEEKHA